MTVSSTRILLLGANGPTGRRTAELALARGYRVVALTRNPAAFPIRDEALTVMAGDATTARTIDEAVAATDVVVSTIGATFTWKPVDVYSTSARHLVAAMRRHDRQRIVVVTSNGVDEAADHGGWMQRFSYLALRRTFAKTVYDDMAELESIVSSSGLDWTIVRPPGLLNEPGSGYEAAEGAIEGALVAREDLAAMLIDQLSNSAFSRKIVGVVTPGLRVGALRMFREEVLKR